MYNLSSIQDFRLPGLTGVFLSEAEIAKRFNVPLEAVDELNLSVQRYASFVDALASQLDEKKMPDLRLASIGVGESSALAELTEIRDAFFSSIGQHTFGSVLATCRMVCDGVVKSDYVDLFLFYLRSRLVSEEVSTVPEVVLLDGAVLHAVWANFARLAEIDQDFLLKNYYLLGLAFGAAVEWNLQRVFSNYVGLLDFIEKYAAMATSLESNVESLAAQSALPILFGQYFVEFHSFHKEKKTPAVDYVKQRIKDFGKISEVCVFGLELAEKIKTATLVPYEEYEKLHDTDPGEIFKKDLVKLFEWYINDKEWTSLVSYFKENRGPVPLAKFFAECRSNFDLEHTEAVDRLTRLSEFLRESGVLKSDQDFITYSEIDGTFCWNDQLLG